MEYLKKFCDVWHRFQGPCFGVLCEPWMMNFAGNQRSGVRFCEREARAEEKMANCTKTTAVTRLSRTCCLPILTHAYDELRRKTREEVVSASAKRERKKKRWIASQVPYGH